MAHFRTGTEVEIKSDATPVTIADKGAERLIREMLAKAFPDDAILGEEEGGDESIPDRWVIDPIDGTKSFISGVPLYGTLVSYEKNGVPILGVCYLPALDEMIYAEVGGGAFLNGRPTRVSDKTDLSKSVISCGGHSGMFAAGRWDGFASLADKSLASRTWNDCFGYTLVASGRIEVMMDPAVSRWDISAFSVIIPEAGGKVTDYDGTDTLAKGHRKLGVVATNGVIHDQILAAFPG